MADPPEAAPATVLEPVVITSERRLTMLDDTPSAVTALNGVKLAEKGATVLADVVTQTPNATFAIGQGSTQLFIRGIGNTFLLAGGDPGVALYVDGIYVSDQTSSNLGLFDAQRVEILRGPRGSLYGRNAVGGAINILSASPGNDFAGRVDLTLGDHGRVLTEGFVTGPLASGSTTARLSYQVQSYDGYTRNRLGGQVFAPVVSGEPGTVAPSRLDDIGSRAVRLQTLGEVGGGSLRLIASHHHEAENGPSANALEDPVMVTKLLYGASPSADPRSIDIQVSSNRIEVNSLSAIYVKPMTDTELTISAGWRSSRVDHRMDADATSAPILDTRFTTRSQDGSVDLHLASTTDAPFQWLLGITHLQFDQRQDVRIAEQVPLGFLVPNGPLDVPVPIRYLLGGKVNTTSDAFYADLRHALGNSITLVGGLRLNRDVKRAYEYLDAAAYGIVASQVLEQAWTSRPANVGVEYRPSQGVLLYAKLSRGFKSGAVNLGSMQTSLIKPETVTSAELGLKADFLDQRASLGLAMFSSRYRDMQVSQVGQFTVNLTNASRATIDGLEVELSMRPFAGLTLYTALGWMNPRYTDFVNTDLRNSPGMPVNVRGRQLTLVSRGQVMLGAEYRAPVDGGSLTMGAEFLWRSRFYFTEFNTPDATQPARGVVNLAASYQPTASRWKLHAYVKNLGNTTAVTSMTIGPQPLLSARQIINAPPRQFGIGASVAF